MFEYDNLALNSTDYSFCSIYYANEVSEPKCEGCLAETGSNHYLSNCKSLALSVQEEPIF
jgi:hypothetical protein